MESRYCVESSPSCSRLWDKKKSKLVLAAELAGQEMKAIGPERQVILLCDSWYPKVKVAALVEQFDNLEMVFNVRVDTALYGLAPAKTGKKSRPRKLGDRIQLDDIILCEPESGDWLIGIMQVIINLWKDKVIYTMATAHKTGKRSRRLFLYTDDLRNISFAWENSAEKNSPLLWSRKYLFSAVGLV